MSEPVAHSAPPAYPEQGSQPYCEHAHAVAEGAEHRAETLLRYASQPPPGFQAAVRDGGILHDLGKLDEENQRVLRDGRGGRLPSDRDHVDAGVAALLAAGAEWAAWLVRAHHSPGLPCCALERSRGRRSPPLKLRGCRRRDREVRDEEHRAFAAAVDARLPGFLAVHRDVCGEIRPEPIAATHGLTMRLALSCLVDADHGDTAKHDRGRDPRPPLSPRWRDRIVALDAFLDAKARKNLLAPVSEIERKRGELRRRFYAACRDSEIDDPVVACTGAVGIGKTYAVTRYLLRQCERANLRRLFVVAPFTNIIDQTVDRLREPKALVLRGEDPDQVVAAHHHRAEFDSLDTREISTLWRAPIVVTTAVQFFETMSANRPASLRKLHELPGSAVFIDEAHAAMPVELWKQYWPWMLELANNWGCRFVLASGSLVRFWELEEIVEPTLRLPDLAQGFRQSSARSERARIRFEKADGAWTRDRLLREIRERINSPVQAPLLVILNTVQSAAVVARALAEDEQGLSISDRRILHLSTALCPRDRVRILREVQRRQKPGNASDHGWVLVATSCVEAGVELDFQSGLREASSVTSVLQTSGRINRSGGRVGSVLTVFTLCPDRQLKQHPAMRTSSEVLQGTLEKLADEAEALDDLATDAIEKEMLLTGGPASRGRELAKAEKCKDYPEVARLGRVIDADTCSVVVDSRLRMLLEARRWPRRPRTFQRRTVQLWAQKVASLALPALEGREIYFGDKKYDCDLIGVMGSMIMTEEDLFI